MIEVYWVETMENVIQLDYYAPVSSWDEYHEAVNRSYEMAKTRSNTVHFLHNPGKVAMPHGNPLTELRRAYHRLPSNTGFIVMVIHNMLALHMMDMAIKILRVSSGRVVNSVADGYRLLDSPDLRMKKPGA